MRFIGRREGLGDELLRRMDWAEDKTAGNTRITLFVAFNYGGRAEIVDAARTFTGRDGGGLPAPPLRTRHARPRPPDPHQRRAAHLELPALAAGLLRVRVPRRAVARLLARGVRGVPRRVRRARSAGSGPVVVAARRDPRAETRRPTRRRRAVGPARPGAVAIPAALFAIFIVWRGRRDVRARPARARRDRARRAVHADGPGAPARARRLPRRWPACSPPRSTASRATW